MMNKWIERSAIISGSLGIIGAVTILFTTFIDYTTTSDEKPTVAFGKSLPTSTKSLRTLENTDSIRNTPLHFKTEQPVTSTAKVLKTPKQTDKPIVKKVDAPKKMLVTTTPKPTTKILSNEELSDVYDAINNQIKNKTHLMNCIQIVSVENANNLHAVSQLEQYLTSKNFILAGRETIETGRNGINIKTKGNCIAVIIGRL